MSILNKHNFHGNSIHLEVSSKCALKCHACPRTEYNDLIKVSELSIETIKNIASTDIKFYDVHLCGDHGDPIYHSSFHEIIDILKTMKGSPVIKIFSNGSYRDDKWWSSLATRLRNKDIFYFSVDGLESTNHLYRKGSDWSTIEKGMRILKKESKCKVVWQWILFQYNQHQIKEGFKLAKEIGIDQFDIVQSYRHDDNNEDPIYKPTITIKEARDQIEKD